MKMNWTVVVLGAEIEELEPLKKRYRLSLLQTDFQKYQNKYVKA